MERDTQNPTRTDRLLRPNGLLKRYRKDYTITPEGIKRIQRMGIDAGERWSRQFVIDRLVCFRHADGVCQLFDDYPCDREHKGKAA